MDKNWLRGKNVLIVGASDGVGKYLAFNLILKFNCSVIGISNNEKQMQEFYEKLGEYRTNFEYYTFDAKNEKAWAEFSNIISTYSKTIDILINCVGDLPKFASVETYTQKDWNSYMGANFYSCVFSTRYMLPFLKQSKKPAIVNISCLGSVLSLGGTSVYSASKSALNSFTQVLASELDNKFYVALVILGAVNTNFYKNQDEKIIKRLAHRAISPKQAANKIIRAVQSKKTRIIIGKNAFFADNFVRLFPRLSQKVIRGYINKKKISLYK